MFFLWVWLWSPLNEEKQLKKDTEKAYKRSDLLAARLLYLLSFLTLSSELIERRKDPLKSTPGYSLSEVEADIAYLLQ